MASAAITRVDLVDSPVDSHPSMDGHRFFLHDPDVGAHVWFYGVTRRTTGDRVTSTLFYEAHPTMAVKQLDGLARRAAEMYGLSRVLIVHATGEVPIGKASVVVGCSGAHRAEVFQAAPWIMQRLKEDVPIWKRETYVDGRQSWIHPVKDQA